MGGDAGIKLEGVANGQSRQSSPLLRYQIADSSGRVALVVVGTVLGAHANCTL